MRKLQLQVQMTVDGFIGGPNGEMDWTTRAWTDDINQYVTGIVQSIDTIVLGRKLAEGFIPYWANVARDMDHPENAAGRIFTNTRKVVFSKTLERSEWENTALAKGDLADEINALKNQPGKDIIAYGGANFVSALINRALIDEFHLFINPVAIGSGLTIFNQLEGNQNLALVNSVAFNCGIVLLHYALKRE
jgi:dihydrofolate reductase